MQNFDLMDPQFIPEVIPDRSHPLTRTAIFERDDKKYGVGCYATFRAKPDDKGNVQVFCYTKITERKADGTEGRSTYRCYPHIQFAWALRDYLLGMKPLDNRIKQIERFSIFHADYVELLNMETMSDTELHQMAPWTMQQMGFGV